MRRAALTLVAVITTFLGSTVYDFSEPVTVRATPSLSGANALLIPNGVPGKGIVGTPPSNYDAGTASQTAGSPHSNYDFASGDFTNWTVTGTPTVNSGGPTGDYANLTSGERIMTPAFTVDAEAQAFTFDAQKAGTGTFQMKVIIYHGTGYSSSTTKFFTSCPSTCTDWNTYQFDAVEWQGESIKLEFQRYLGNVNVDNVFLPLEVVTGWDLGAGNSAKRLSGGPGGNYFQFAATTLTSPAFTVSDDAPKRPCGPAGHLRQPGLRDQGALRGELYDFDHCLQWRIV